MDYRRSKYGKSLVLTAVMCLTGCMPAPPIAATPAACASLIPDTWRKPVPGIPLPIGQTIGDWISLADQLAGQLDKANDRTLSAIGITERCENRDRASVAKVRRKVLGMF